MRGLTCHRNRGLCAIDSVVQPCVLPDSALLGKYREQGAYTDCYVTEVAGSVSHAAFVEAFYTTALFKLERAILAGFAARPSTHAQARQLAQGRTDTFAAWRVEGRGIDQLLLADFTGRTRSWLMVSPFDGAEGTGTRLYFGSAVVPRVDARTGKRTMGAGFQALLGFHRVYSRQLLTAARSRILAGR